MMRNSYLKFERPGMLVMFSAIAAMILLSSVAWTAEKAKPFYKDGPLFAFTPKENKGGQSVDRFGPVGIGIELTLPAFGMKIKNVEKHSFLKTSILNASLKLSKICFKLPPIVFKVKGVKLSSSTVDLLFINWILRK